MAVLPQRLADALGDPTVGLAVQNEWIDGSADIVDRSIAHELDMAGIGIDLDLGDVRSVRESGFLEQVVGRCRKLSGELRRQVRAIGSGSGDLCEAEGRVGPAPTYDAALKLHLALGRLEHHRG